MSSVSDGTNYQKYMGDEAQITAYIEGWNDAANGQGIQRTDQAYVDGYQDAGTAY